MQLKQLLFILLFFCPTLIFSQYSYHKTYHGVTSNNSYYSMIWGGIEKQGNFNKDNILFGGNTISSINKYGQINWSKTYYDTTVYIIHPNVGDADAIVNTSNGGFIVGHSGAFYSGSSATLIRCDSLGNLIWSKSIGLSNLPNKTLFLNEIKKTFSGNYLIHINIHESVYLGSSVLLLEIDENGNLLWQKIYNIGYYNTGSEILENNLGYIFASAYYITQIDFNGNVLWSKNFTISASGYPSLLHTVGNDIIATVDAGINTQGYYIFRLDNTGSVVWSKRYSGNHSLQNNSHPVFKKMSDSNILRVEMNRVYLSQNTHRRDIIVSEIDKQNGDISWKKRYSDSYIFDNNYTVNLGTNRVSHRLDDCTIISDSIINILTEIKGNYMPLNLTNYKQFFLLNLNSDSSSTNCYIQEDSFDIVQDDSLVSILFPVQLLPYSLNIQNRNLEVINGTIIEYLECENGIAANFEVSDFLLCKNDCITIEERSVGSINDWEWTFFGTDTISSNAQFPSPVCYADTGVFSIQLVVGNGILTDTLRKTIKVYAPPIVDLGEDTTLCQGQFITPYFQITDATYLWNNLSTASYLFINTAGTYEVEVTKGGCVDRDTLNVNIEALPIIDLGVDTTLCGSTYLIDPAFNNNYTYEWQDNSTNSQYLATVSGLYSVSVTDTLGCENTDEILIGFNAIPSINLGNDTSICQGENITLKATSPNATYLWNDNSTDSILVVNSSGIYSVEVLVNGCSANDTIEIVVENLPIVNLGNDTTFCNANGYNLMANTANNVTYLWNNNATTESFFINNSGIYSLIVTDTFTTCQASDSVEINLIQSANFNLGNDTTLCQGEILSLDVFTPNATYLWNDNSTGSVLNINNSGIYSVDVTLNNCIESDTISVVFNDLPTVDLGNDTTFCNENNIEIIPNTNSNNLTYLWNNSATAETIFINNSDVYSVIITDTFTNCQATDSIAINLIQTDSFDLGEDTILCNNQTILLNAFVENANYSWNNGSDSSELLIQNSGLYSVEVSIENCSTLDSINIIFIEPNSLDFGANTILCNDEIVALEAFDANAISYLWQDNSTFSNFEVTTAGTYFVDVIYNKNCQVSDTITFIPEGKIAPTLPNDTIICNNNSVTLNAYQPNAISYEWETQAAYFEQHDLQDSVIVATLSGEYKLTVRNECRAFTQFINIEEEDCSCSPYIPNAFSPNGDGINDDFRVYSNCTLFNYTFKIFDRWGGILFKTNDISEGWNGTKTGENLVNGVYVWVVTYEALNQKGEMENFTRSGSLTLIR